MTLLLRIYVGSPSDHKQMVASGMLDILDRTIGADAYTVTDASAHRNPEWVETWVRADVHDGIKAFMAVAGLANDLAGAIAAHTKGLCPVIGVPLTEGQENNITSTPKDRPLLLAGAGQFMLEKAAIAVAQLFAMTDPEVQRRLKIYLAEEAAKKPPKRDIKLPPNPLSTGKVRSTYYVNGHHLLQVSSDQISVFDVVLEDENGKKILIPGKGKVLTGLTDFWLTEVFPDLNHHLLTADISDLNWRLQAIPDVVGRAVLVRKCEMLDVEFIMRAFMYGSGWREYKKKGTIGGEQFREGYDEADRLDEVLLTPSTKAKVGHDVNIGPAEAREIVIAQGFPGEFYDQAEAIALEVFTRGSKHMEERGLILADTKFEFGVIRDAEGNPKELVLCDEVLTPDSSRFWDLEAYANGQGGSRVVQYDKEIVRAWYLANHPEWAANASNPAPVLPKSVRTETAERYAEMLERITA